MAGVEVEAHVYRWPVRHWFRRRTWWMILLWIGDEEIGWTQAQSIDEVPLMARSLMNIERGAEGGPYTFEFTWHDGDAPVD